jgi:hypothetical protein
MAGGRRPVAVLAAALLLGVSGASAVAAEAPIGWDSESLPSLAVARGASPASAVLPDGDVLVIGGNKNGSKPVALRPERFDGATRTWSRTGPPEVFHGAWPAAVALRDGRVLAVGGSGTSGNPFPARAESYDPAGNTWTLVGRMPSGGREDPEALLLQDGRVLVTGGYGPAGASAGTDIYNPLTRTWTAAAPMATPRWNHTATLLRDGRVLVAGGLTGGWQAISAVEVYDPVSNTWTPAAALAAPRFTHAAVLLGNGRVMVMGTYWTGDPRSTEIYNPDTNTWAPGPSMLTGRAYATAHRLPAGGVLVIGGKDPADQTSSLATAEYYDPSTRAWSLAGVMASPHHVHTSALSGGQVIVAGGASDWMGMVPSRATELLALPN